MAKNTGTLVIDMVRPYDSLDTYAVALCNEIQGGLHIYDTDNDLQNSISQRNKIGMLATVVSSVSNQNQMTVFQLSSASTWVPLQLGGSSLSGYGYVKLNGTTITYDNTAFQPLIPTGTTAQYYRGDKTWFDFDTSVNNNSNVLLNTASRHNPVTIGTPNGLSLSGQTLSLGLSTSSTTGALSNTDWSNFNSKEPAIISGTIYDYYRGDKTWFNFNSGVSANPDVTANSLARHNPITLGTANGLSLNNQVLSLGVATSTTTGALTYTDWVNFNSAYTYMGNNNIVINTTNFNNNLNSGDTTIQKALDTIDDIVFPNVAYVSTEAQLVAAYNKYYQAGATIYFLASITLTTSYTWDLSKIIIDGNRLNLIFGANSITLISHYCTFQNIRFFGTKNYSTNGTGACDTLFILNDNKSTGSRLTFNNVQWSYCFGQVLDETTHKYSDNGSQTISMLAWGGTFNLVLSENQFLCNNNSILAGFVVRQCLNIVTAIYNIKVSSYAGVLDAFTTSNFVVAGYVAINSQNFTSDGSVYLYPYPNFTSITQSIGPYDINYLNEKTVVNSNLDYVMVSDGESVLPMLKKVKLSNLGVSSGTTSGTTGGIISLGTPTNGLYIDSNSGLSLSAATSTNNGALTSTDWSTFNNKQPQLNGYGVVVASGTTITYDPTVIFNFYVSMDFQEAIAWTYVCPYNMQILSYETSPTANVTITVSGSTYTLGSNLNKFDRVVITPNIMCFVNMYCKKI